MKKLLLIGLGCLALAGMGAASEAQAGVQVSINLGGSRPYYHRPPPSYYYYPPPVVYSRPVVVYGRPPVYCAPPVHVYRRPYAYR